MLKQNSRRELITEPPEASRQGSGEEGSAAPLAREKEPQQPAREDFGPPPRSPRYASLDAWRGIACLAIVIYHASLQYQAELYHAQTEHVKDLSGHILDAIHFLSYGVPVFFVISGYCISATADNGRRRGRTLGEYFKRRFRRIFPPFWVLLSLSIGTVAIFELALAPGLLVDPPRGQLLPWNLGLSQWIGNITLTETWRPHVFGLPRGQFVGQAWTLCYEEQFYAMVGLLLCISARRFFLLAGITTIACVGLHAVLTSYGINDNGFFFDGNWLMFAAGILLYYQVNYADRRTNIACYMLFGVALIVSFALPGGHFSSLTFALAFALTAAILHPWDQQLAQAKWIVPLNYCGTMCYSLYLVHGLLVRIVQKQMYEMGVNSARETLLITIPICVAISVLAGAAFYHLVESRFLNSSTRQHPSPPNSGAR